MSVSTVSSGNAALQMLRANFQDRKNDIDQLQQSLSTGDLNGAQQAYNSLSQLIQNGPGGQNGQPFGGNATLQKDFAALGDALKSGDAASAQKAFAQFMQDLQAARQAHKGHHGQRGQSAQDAANTNSSTQNVDADGDNDGSTTAVNLTA